MVAEIILILAIIGIFILVARRLPDALSDGQPTATAKTASTIQSKQSLLSRFSRMFQHTARQDKNERTRVSAANPPSPDNLTQRQALLSDEALLREGDSYLNDGRLKEAERAYLRGVAKNPKNPKLYNRLGAIYLKQKNYRDALEAFEAARDFDATRASRHYNVALAAWHLKRRAKASSAIAEAVRLDGASQKYRELANQIERD